MLITTGRVNGGHIEFVDEALPEGTTVTILAAEDETFVATPEEEARLIAAIAEAQRGEVIDASELLEQLNES